MSVVTEVNWLKYRRTKIVATVGPSCNSDAVLELLMQAGVNVFRLNLSHGTQEEHGEVVDRIRELAHHLEFNVAILADLSGPKIRVGSFEGGGIELIPHEQVTVTTRDVSGMPGLIPSQYEALSSDVKQGDRILMDDGNLELEVVDVVDTEILCNVTLGGFLSDHKGIHLPGISVSAPSMTDKDYDDANYMLTLGVDFVALSYVRAASDIEELQHLLDAHDTRTEIIAKIEKAEALVNADEILEAADGIMVARGDLGVELRPEEVPVAQAKLVELARQHNKPVIVATQMLESMIDHGRPTRAEVTDVAHAVGSGTDAVMLSAETAVGQFPLEAVSMMDRIARQTEAHLWRSGEYGKVLETENRPLWRIVADAASTVSREILARGVVVISQSGRSADSVSASRPAAPVVVITADAELVRQLSLRWGVIPVLRDNIAERDLTELAREVALGLGLGESGQHILLMRGFNVDPALNTPTVTVVQL